MNLLMRRDPVDENKIRELTQYINELKTERDYHREMYEVAENAVVGAQAKIDSAGRENITPPSTAPVTPLNSTMPPVTSGSGTTTGSTTTSGGVVTSADSGATTGTIYNKEGGRHIESSTSPTGWIDEETGLPTDPENSTLVGDVNVVGVRNNSEMAIAPSDDRVRIKPLNSAQFYGPTVSESNAEEVAAGSHLLEAIRATNGVIFPYTPVITYGHNVNYTTGSIVHANQDYLFYNNTASVQFNLVAKFSVQNEQEAAYYLGAKHFFSTASKMFFGDSDEDNRGLPPPVLILSGYGDLMLNNLPVVLNSFNVELPDSVDYVEANVIGTTNRVPALSTFQLTFTVQNTPVRQRSFNFGEFASGELLKDRGWI